MSNLMIRTAHTLFFG